MSEFNSLKFRMSGLHVIESIENFINGMKKHPEWRDFLVEVDMQVEVPIGDLSDCLDIITCGECAPAYQNEDVLVTIHKCPAKYIEQESYF